MARTHERLANSNKPKSIGALGMIGIVGSIMCLSIGFGTGLYLASDTIVHETKLIDAEGMADAKNEIAELSRQLAAAQKKIDEGNEALRKASAQAQVDIADASNGLTKKYLLAQKELQKLEADVHRLKADLAEKNSQATRSAKYMEDLQGQLKASNGEVLRLQEALNAATDRAGRGDAAAPAITADETEVVASVSETFSWHSATEEVYSGIPRDRRAQSCAAQVEKLWSLDVKLQGRAAAERNVDVVAAVRALDFLQCGNLDQFTEDPLSPADIRSMSGNVAMSNVRRHLPSYGTKFK